jgi:DNA-binding response OmpR family regulator
VTHPPDISRLPVLLVDDDDGNREVVAYYLRRQGFEVTPAASAREALEALAASRYAIVLLDVVMPEMNGFAALERIRERFTALELPVVMFTGLDADEATRTAVELGANDCLAKPYQLSDILSCIRRHLEASVAARGNAAPSRSTSA